MDLRQILASFRAYAILAVLGIVILLGSYAIMSVAVGALIVAGIFLMLAWPFLLAWRFVYKTNLYGTRAAAIEIAQIVGGVTLCFAVFYVWERMPPEWLVLCLIVTLPLWAFIGFYQWIADWWRSKRP